MLKETITPLQQAYKEIPPAWYELNVKTFYLSAAISSLITGYAYQDVLQSHINSPYIHLIGGLIYLISTLVDRKSTIGLLQAEEVAEESGIPVTHTESSWAFKPNVRTEEFKKNKLSKAADMAIIGSAIINPGLGVSFGGAKTIAVLNNNRAAKRYLKAVELAKPF